MKNKPLVCWPRPIAPCFFGCRLLNLSAHGWDTEKRGSSSGAGRHFLHDKLNCSFAVRIRTNSMRSMFNPLHYQCTLTQHPTLLQSTIWAHFWEAKKTLQISQISIKSISITLPCNDSNVYLLYKQLNIYAFIKIVYKIVLFYVLTIVRIKKYTHVRIRIVCNLWTLIEY